ncbi:Ku protein [Alicyclobacillus sp.]|uniref:non-homologous end joining protein Ku n=1 Tax=Alicyclobacillus sp. TaxID=61169 RepID=UPI0025BD820D|nr:Ku protein [Alicyclobacillus sp.]MCL6515524.1 Ku protein [Alicyclobacillus sp.]
MHTMWKGSISFGLVNVPVRMFAATESKDVKFRYLHKPCRTPIEYKRTCPTCDRPVPWEEIVRGFEYEPNRFVVLDEEDLAAIKQERSQTIDIVDFVELREIDPVYYDRTYYLAPERAGVKAYRLLERAMRETGKIAIARTVLRNRETLACIRVHGGVILMETLFWPDEVRSTDELPNLTVDAAPSEREVEMAITLVNQLSTRFEPEKYVDEHRNEVMALIERKIANEEVAQPAAAASRAENIVDLMEALQESIRQTKPKRQTRKKKTS